MANATDPICLMQVDTKNPNGGTSEHDGQTYYFCAPGCRIAFERDADGWASGRNKPISMEAPHSQPLTIVRRLFRRNSQ